MPRTELRKEDDGYGHATYEEMLALDKHNKTFISEKCRLCGGDRDSLFWICSKCMPKRIGKRHDPEQSLCDVCDFFMYCRQKLSVKLPVLCEGLDNFSLDYAKKHGLDIDFSNPPQAISHQNNIENSSYFNVFVDNNI